MLSITKLALGLLAVAAAAYGEPGQMGRVDGECKADYFTRVASDDFKAKAAAKPLLKAEAKQLIVKAKGMFKDLRALYQSAKRTLRGIKKSAPETKPTPLQTANPTPLQTANPTPPQTANPTPLPTPLPTSGDVWVNSAKSIAVTSGGTVATRNTLHATAWKEAAGGEQMEAGVHYWEVTTTKDESGMHWFVGVSKPDLDRETSHYGGNEAWYLIGDSGGLYGNGKSNSDFVGAGKIAVGDKVGMLLDLTAGTLMFYLNGDVFGPGHSGVKGPVVRTVAMYKAGTEFSLDVTATRPQQPMK